MLEAIRNQIEVKRLSILDYEIISHIYGIDVLGCLELYMHPSHLLNRCLSVFKLYIHHHICKFLSDHAAVCYFVFCSLTSCPENIRSTFRWLFSVFDDENAKKLNYSSRNGALK